MNTYTNTSNVKGIVGLLVLTVGLAYAQSHATEIVDGTVAKAKLGVEKLNEIVHLGKKQYSVCERTYSGEIRDTGKRIWR